MKRLLIVRHAKSSWDYPELRDIDRPLNKRGKRNAPEMGRRLAQRGISPDILISSPAKRAWSTAKRLAEALGYDLGKIKIEQNLYHGTVNDISDIIRSMDNSMNTIMIFGHNPDLTTFTNKLSGSDIYNIPTCGIAEIQFEISSWEEIVSGKGILKSFDYPKKALSY